jgi:hypothetical protein
VDNVLVSDAAAKEDVEEEDDDDVDDVGRVDVEIPTVPVLLGILEEGVEDCRRDVFDAVIDCCPCIP